MISLARASLFVDRASFARAARPEIEQEQERCYERID